jgi:hypothetical protein
VKTIVLTRGLRSRENICIAFVPNVVTNGQRSPPTKGGKMLNFIHAHTFEILLVYWIFNLAISTMPTLPENSGFFASWLFRLAHAIGGNSSSLISSFKKLEDLK